MLLLLAITRYTNNCITVHRLHSDYEALPLRANKHIVQFHSTVFIIIDISTLDTTCKTIKKKAKEDIRKHNLDEIRETIEASNSLKKVRRTHSIGKNRMVTLLDKHGREIQEQHKIMERIDDTALIADSEEGIQRLLDLVLDASSDEGLEINCKKTFCMVVSKERQPPTCNLICNGTGIEQVNSFNYLGSMLTSDGRCEKEIRRRIEMAKTSFNRMSPVLKDRKLSIPLKVRLLKCFIWSVLLYGCESWTLSTALTRNIEATEMWFYRRMLRVSYTAHETNISVLQRMGQERQLLRTIKERQTRFTGHIIRKGEGEDLILAGKVQRKKARGGQRLLFLNQVKENTGLTSPRTIWDAARNRTLKIKTS